MPLPGLLSMQRHLEADSASCNNSDTAKKRPPLPEKNLPARESSGGFLPVSSMLPPGGGGYSVLLLREEIPQIF